VISTRLVRRRSQVIELEQLLTNRNIILLEDESYKTAALEKVLDSNRKIGTTYSLTDGVIREVLKDVTIRIDFLATYNQRDFSDICQSRQISILE
jgi:hypothetical protein